MKDSKTPPEGTRPLMISMREMETLGLKTGSGLRDTVEYRIFSRQNVLNEIAQVGFMSPFHTFRTEIRNITFGDDLLVIADREEKYGENWLLCLTEQAFESQLEQLKYREKDHVEIQEKDKSDDVDEFDISMIVYEDKPILTRPWSSPTIRETYEQVLGLNIRSTRPLIAMSVTKISDELNAEYKFSDRDADQCFVEWRQHKDPNYELIRAEQDVGLQCTLPLVDNSTQTSWFRSINSALQYEPMILSTAQCQVEMESDKMHEFLTRVLPLIERVLQQNEALDVFLDPFAHLLEEEDTLINTQTHENGMRELRSFTDLVYSKNKTLRAIDWHPKRYGIVAVAATTNASFAKRLDLFDTIESSYILIWNFVDLIHPQIMLESPQDVMTMRFNPTAPHIVAAGLYNGQVLVWDFLKMESILLNTKPPKTSTTDSSSSMRNDTRKATPVKPLYVSYIDVSHRRPVADLQWLPAGVEINSRGHIVISPNSDTVTQFVTISADGQVLFWDLRFKDPKYGHSIRSKVDKSGSKDGTFDVPFVPIYSITLTKPDGPGELALQSIWLEKNHEESKNDWRPHALLRGNGSKNDDIGRGDNRNVEYVQWLCRDHTRPIFGLFASPFFPTIFLTASETHFHLWDVSHPIDESAKDTANATNGPMFVSPLTQSSITCVAFSPTRPGVLFLGKADGNLEIWDFMDQSHRSSLLIGITACALTSMEFRSQIVPSNNPLGGTINATGTGTVTNRAKATKSATGARGRTTGPVPLGTTNMKQQLVAVGDQMGNLHILEIPRVLSRPASGERGAMEMYFKRESERMRTGRNDCKVDGTINVRQKTGDDVTVFGTESGSSEKEIDATSTGTIDSFQQMETEFCREMGLETSKR
ncbi:Cytoplasmic dynein intermediate chain [Plasmopara halstedii]|uniref:Cytoplasmic dynein intermediate chain n=1 Tax=Plasmopara halstedii TaxID=4781 RepID=A0A0N7L865_PLAHL|nr:Cytoplasmic dynein intermediate chain [Plasmopara halstedii]CEG49011.1 Cytoplasmic dynein intermediate chain [Plasmopara halstedii]|eukprot:XP_024585380.1 Cytoplasmic dynein intermediate chain [Plasmopara halstedii]